jgi:hypothetical protein
VFTVVDHGKGETLEALATFPTAERADAVADLLNLLAAEHPPTGVRERLQAALDSEPGPVRASVNSIVDRLDQSERTLANHLQRRLAAAFACFPISGCPPTGCGKCVRCADNCVDCTTCDDAGCDTCLLPAITPRTAFLLHAAGEILSDETAAALEDPGDWDQFPPFFQHLSSVAVDKFAAAFLSLAADLAHSVEPHPRSTAEEIALHLMTERAKVELELGSFDDYLDQLPESQADYDWDAVLEDLYQDSDYVGLMSHPGKLAASTVVGLFERFANMPEREQPATL